MAEFINAIGFVLEHEGGFVDHPHDPGGATNYGISLRFLKRQGLDVNLDGDINVEDIEHLTMEQAADIYQEHWWARNRYSMIENQRVATKIFDLAVNMGSRQAHKLLQRAVNENGYDLDDDGVIGSKTLYAVDNVDPEDLLYSLIKQAETFYRTLVEKNPKFSSFINGWLRRARAIPSE